jgi:nucleoid-associated protein YgaU
MPCVWAFLDTCALPISVPALGFGALNRLADLSAQGGVQMHFDYDHMDNRVHEHIDYQSDSQGARTQDLWYAYDAMNRQILVDGAVSNNAGDLANLQDGQGHIVAWDRNGNRISDTFVGNHVTQSGGDTVDGGLDESGNPVTVTTPVTWGKAVGVTSETYRYDVNNRLVEVQRDGVMIDTRYYDGADRVVQTGPAATLAQGYVEQLNNGPVGNGSESRINRYDADGHLLHQQVSKSDGAPKYDIDYQVDAAGNVVGYTDVTHGENGYTASYGYTQLRQDGYKEATITGTRTDNAGAPGVTTDSYDVNGTLVGITDSTRAENNRSFISDAAGIVLQKTQQGHIQRQIVVGGQVVGQLGTGLDPQQPVDKDGNQHYVDYQNFNLGYRAIDANYPTAEAGSTVVQAGDTLQGIAQKAYGDAQLWYLIADANGIQGNSDLRVGQTLQLPNRVGTVHNNATTFKPYEPGKILGDTTPNLPAPSGGDDCGGFGMILVVVVAVVVTVLTAGAAAPALGAITTAGASTWATGMAALAGELGADIAIAAGAIGGAVGSIASQGVGMAVGVQQDFSWSSVALAAVGGGVSGGLAGIAPVGGLPTSFGNVVARAAIGNAVSQGIGIATGLQDHFSWVGVAAAGVGAGVGFGMSEALGITSNGVRTTAFDKAGFGEQVVKAGMTGFAAGMATAVARGGRISVTQVATDAFGNALGNSISEQMALGNQQDPALGKTFAEDRARRRQANPLLASDLQADTTSEATPPPGMEGRPLINSVVFNGGSNYASQWRLNQSMVGGAGSSSAPANGSDDPNAVNYRNGPDIESDNADRNGNGPIRTMTSVTVSRGDSVEKLARDIYGDQWRAGMATLIRDNGIKLNQWGSPIIRDGQSLGAWDLGAYSEEGLQRLGRASNAIEANNSRGLAAKADLEAQKAALEAQAATDSERYREANRFASMSRSVPDGGPAQGNPSGSLTARQGDAASTNRSAMIAAGALGGEFSLIADGLPADVASGYAGPGKAIADPLARGITVANDTLHDFKESAKDLIVKGGAWGLQRGGIVGSAAYYGGGLAYVLDDILQPGNLLDVGLLAGAPAFGKVVGAGVSVLNKLPVLGTDIGEVAGKTVYELGESLANRIEGMQDSLGLRLGVVEPNAARLRSVADLGRENLVEIVWLDSSEIRLAQKSISYLKRGGYTLDDIARGFVETPSDTRLMIDVVRMKDGLWTSVDTSRPSVLNVMGGGQIQSRLRGFGEPLGPGDIRRFTVERPNGDIRVPSTWGEAVETRIWKQGDQFSTLYPNGTLAIPKISGAPVGSVWSQFNQYQWKR